MSQSSESVRILLVPLVLLGFGDLRLSVGGQGLFTISPFETWAYVVVAILLTQTSLSSKPGFRIAGAHWLGTYVLWALVCALNFPLPEQGYPIPFDFKILIPSASVFVATVILARRSADVALLVRVWLLAGLANVLLALVQLVAGMPYPVALSETATTKLTWEGAEVARLVTGFFAHPNTLAQAMLPWFVITASVVLQRGVGTKTRLLMMMCTVAFGVALAATAAKGPVPWAFAGVIVAVLTERTRWARNTGLLALLWLGLVATIIALALVLTTQFRVATLQTILPRLALISVALQLFLSHPATLFLGGGLQIWPQYVSTIGGWEFYNAHNVYVNHLLMYGLIGLFLFLAFLISVVRRPFHLERPHVGYLSPFPYVGAIFAITGSYFFEPSFSHLIIKHQLLFSAALVIVTTRLASSTQPGSQPRPRANVSRLTPAR